MSLRLIFILLVGVISTSASMYLTDLSLIPKEIGLGRNLHLVLPQCVDKLTMAVSQEITGSVAVSGNEARCSEDIPEQRIIIYSGTAVKVAPVLV